MMIEAGKNEAKALAGVMVGVMVQGVGGEGVLATASKVPWTLTTDPNWRVPQ